MECGIFTCDGVAVNMVVTKVLDREYQIPRCERHTTRNDSYIELPNKKRGK